jgi:predicted amidophosphoribosyltransferase
MSETPPGLSPMVLTPQERGVRPETTVHETSMRPMRLETQKGPCAACGKPTANIPALCEHCLAERQAHRIAKARARKRRA